LMTGLVLLDITPSWFFLDFDDKIRNFCSFA
jgi:hypothetical protein